MRTASLAHPLALLARLACLWLALCLLPAAAQLPRLASPASAPAAAEVRDPLDRGTPRRAITGFIRAAHRDNLATAARYVQAGNRPPARVERMVRELNDLMDRHFHQPLSAISDVPEGAADDGLPLDRERIGPLRIAGEEHFIELVRVDQPGIGKVWLISSDTLAQVPELGSADADTWVERVVPAPLFREVGFGFSWADLLLWAATLALPLLLLPPLFAGLQAIARRMVRTPARVAPLDAWYQATRWPAILVCTLGIHGAALTWFGPTLSFRIGYSRILVLLAVAVVGWGLHRALSFAFRRAGLRAQLQGRSGTRSLVMLGERLTNAFLVLVVVLAILAIAGFDIKTVLAGLGIVGVALALGAQKTIENILGGVMLLGDEAIAVGDLCRISNRLGVVEDITLRSVRFRTTDHTLLSIPAGVLAQAEIENYASRDRILLQCRMRLAYDTPVDAVRRVRDDIAALLANHPAVDPENARVRLVDFGLQGMELELFAYIRTSEVLKFLSIREELLLDAAGCVEAAGASFAGPPPLAQPALVP